MGYPETFEGFCVDGPETWNQFHKAELEIKPFGSHDIDIAIDACGVCGSDVHTITGGWGEYTGPLCIGHEVVGRAIKVGPHVKDIKEGDRVGVGAQVYSCMECDLCKSENENYCAAKMDTYNSWYPDGNAAHGGFASHIRAHEHYAFRIPEELKTEDAAPLLCAGITTYSPLVRANVGPGKKVAVCGIGGLGHLGIQWAVALGAETYALTHSRAKVDDCLKLGALEAIVTGEENWQDNWALTFDFILNCSDMLHKLDISAYFSTLKIGGEFHMVGLPDKPLPELRAQAFTFNAPKLTGSRLGNHREMDALLKLAAEKGIKPWVDTIHISEKGCAEAVERVKDGKVRYRLTLTGFDKVFGQR